MNDITLRDLLRFIDDDTRLSIQMTDSNGDVHSVRGFVRDLVVMLGAEALNRKVDMMMETVLHEICVIVYPELQESTAPEKGKTMRLSEALETYMNDRVVIYFTETMEQIHGAGGFFATTLNEETLNMTVRDISRNNYGYAIRVEG